VSRETDGGTAAENPPTDPSEPAAAQASEPPPAQACEPPVAEPRVGSPADEGGNAKDRFQEALLSVIVTVGAGLGGLSRLGR